MPIRLAVIVIEGESLRFDEFNSSLLAVEMNHSSNRKSIVTQQQRLMFGN